MLIDFMMTVLILQTVLQQRTVAVVYTSTYVKAHTDETYTGHIKKNSALLTGKKKKKKK